MPYVIRDSSGNIKRATVKPVHGAEVIPFDHPDLIAFLQDHGEDPALIDKSMSELKRTDADMSRAVEDVIVVLLRKNVLKMTELPKPVQEKMEYRVRLRLQIQETLDQASAQSEKKAFLNEKQGNGDNAFF